MGVRTLLFEALASDAAIFSASWEALTAAASFALEIVGNLLAFFVFFFVSIC